MLRRPTLLLANSLVLLAAASTAAPQYGASPGGSLALGVAGGSDDCSTAQAIGGAGLFLFDTATASTGTEGQSEALCSSFGTSGIENDVWFSWTADFSGTATISTCGFATVDTKLAVYPGAGCPIDGTALACNDDACGLQSQLQFEATTGSTYLLQVGTFPGTGGGTGQVAIDAPGVALCSVPHDGASETSLGLTFGGDTAALVYVDCLAAIETIEVAYGSPTSPGGIPAGSPVVLGIWDDPTDDEDPADAVLLQEIPIPAGVVNPDLDQFTTYDLTSLIGAPVAVSGGAFVGVVVTHGANQWPFGLDQSSSQEGRNWIAGATAAGGVAFDLANLAANDAAPATLESIQFPGHWLLHATGPQAPDEPGTGFCFCDAGMAPCSNSGAAGRGCASSVSTAGAHLTASGIADVAADTVSLLATGLVPAQPGLFFQGDTEVAGGAGFPFGDGLRCAGGNVLRVEIVFADAGGAASSSSSLSVAGSVASGELRTYQMWYRDPITSPCGSLFNLTNGYRIQW